MEPLKEFAEGKSNKETFVLNLDVGIPELDEMTKEVDRLNEVAEASIKHSENRTQTKSECFVATAAYGSELHPKVTELRRFRDIVLSRYALGRALISFYIRISPPIARQIERNEWLRARTRTVLRVIIFFVSLINAPKYRF